MKEGVNPSKFLIGGFRGAKGTGAKGTVLRLLLQGAMMGKDGTTDPSLWSMIHRLFIQIKHAFDALL